MNVDVLLHNSVARAGGVIGIFTSFMAYYVGLSELLAAEERPVFTLPLGIL
jgi:succinate-acetate transporter protein